MHGFWFYLSSAFVCLISLSYGIASYLSLGDIIYLWNLLVIAVLEALIKIFHFVVYNNFACQSSTRPIMFYVVFKVPDNSQVVP